MLYFEDEDNQLIAQPWFSSKDEAAKLNFDFSDMGVLINNVYRS